MKGIAAALIAVFVLWVVDVNFNSGRYTDVIVRIPAACRLINRYSNLRPPQLAASFISRAGEKRPERDGGLGTELGPPIVPTSNAETSGQRLAKLPQLG